MPRKKLVIFPYNGNGIEAMDCINDDEFELVGFVDDDINKKPGRFPLFSRDILSQHKEFYLLAVPGSPSSFLKRQAIIQSLSIEMKRFVSVIHPSANIGKSVQIGYNCLIMAGVVLTSDATIQNHVCILPNSVIHHNCKIGEYTLVGSNVVVAGGTTVGRNCYIGSGTNIINGITIGDFSLTGLGSNIVKDVTDNAKMVGNPARNLSSRSL
jgi:UDP-perosamine 4-acetyltransferase